MKIEKVLLFENLEAYLLYQAITKVHGVKVRVPQERVITVPMMQHALKIIDNDKN